MTGLARIPPADILLPTGSLFGATLRRFRERAGLSQNALAQRAGVNASYINRLESGDRRRPTEQVCAAIGRTMHLTIAELDELLLSAGYAPLWLRLAGTADPTVNALASLLTDDAISDGALLDARAVIETVITRFRQAGAPRQLTTGGPR